MYKIIYFNNTVIQILIFGIFLYTCFKAIISKTYFLEMCTTLVQMLTVFFFNIDEYKSIFEMVVFELLYFIYLG